MDFTFEAFLKKIRANTKRFKQVFYGNLVIGFVGWYVSTLSFVSMNIFTAILGSLTYTLIVAFVNNLAAYYIDTVDEFNPKPVTIDELGRVSQASDMVLYVSSTLTFRDWFHPNLVRYLLSTSTSHRNTGSRAIRVFVLNNDAASELRMLGHSQEIAYRSLIYIHGILGIQCVKMSNSRIQEITDRVTNIQASTTQSLQNNSFFKGYDFCVGFRKPQGNINESIRINPRNFSPFCGACPTTENISEYRFLPDISTSEFHKNLSINLIKEIFDDRGNIRPEFILEA